MTTLRAALLLPLALCGCDSAFTHPERAYGEAVPAEAAHHPTTVHLPRTLGVVDTPLEDIHGTPIGVACVTCHGPDPEVAWVAGPGEPDTFHGSVTVQHGDLTCNHCHEPEDRSLLRLADGSAIEMAETMQLCAQCHGTQKKSWDHGAHGGMTGHWDTRQGPRSRNHCVDCHAPHAPATEQVMPVLPPRDRYLPPREAP